MKLIGNLKMTKDQPFLTQTSTKFKHTNWGSLKFWQSKTWSNIKEVFEPRHDYITPSFHRVFRPFQLTPLHKVKVVFVAPAPYSLPDVADGLAFSWKINAINKDFDSAPFPFYALMKELQRSHGLKPPRHGDLRSWAKQGVLLWNSQLTTIRGHTMAHMGLGWQLLTREVIETVYLQNPKAVFVFFGELKYLENILPDDANVFHMPMPMPTFTANRPSNIWKSGIFKMVDDVLRKNGRQKINWKV